MGKNKITVFAPGTIANCGPGFDTLGCAVEGIGDTVEAEITNKAGVEIVEITGDDGKLSTDAKKNTAGIAAAETLKLLGVKKGIQLRLHKGLPIGSGLGSSAASAAAAAYAVNMLFGGELTKLDLVGPCLVAEKAVSGYHADNVAPSLFGGFVLIRSLEPLDLIPLGGVDDAYFIIVHPEQELSTKESRKKLPKQVSLESAIHNNAHIAAFVAGVLKNDVNLVGRSIKDDIVEPVRSLLIPGYKKVKDAAMDAGALACSISGAGPSVFALAPTKKGGEIVGAAMQKAFKDVGYGSAVYVIQVCRKGAHVVD